MNKKDIISKDEQDFLLGKSSKSSSKSNNKLSEKSFRENLKVENPSNITVKITKEERDILLGKNEKEI